MPSIWTTLRYALTLTPRGSATGQSDDRDKSSSTSSSNPLASAERRSNERMTHFGEETPDSGHNNDTPMRQREEDEEPYQTQASLAIDTHPDPDRAETSWSDSTEHQESFQFQGMEENRYIDAPMEETQDISGFETQPLETRLGDDDHEDVQEEEEEEGRPEDHSNADHSVLEEQRQYPSDMDAHAASSHHDNLTDTEQDTHDPDAEHATTTNTNEIDQNDHRDAYDLETEAAHLSRSNDFEHETQETHEDHAFGPSMQRLDSTISLEPFQPKTGKDPQNPKVSNTQPNKTYTSTFTEANLATARQHLGTMKEPKRASPARHQRHVSMQVEPRHPSFPPPLPARRKDSFQRYTSISKVFNKLPPRLPSDLEMLVDLLEYQCHVCLLASDKDRNRECLDQLDRSMQAIPCMVTDEQKRETLLSRGRLFSRLHITSLAGDIMQMELPSRETYQQTASGVQPEHWKRLREQLIFVKSCILRKDANKAVHCLQDESSGEANGNDDIMEMDDSLQQHDMIKGDYEDVLELLEVQEILYSFWRALHVIQKDHALDPIPVYNGVVKKAISTYESRLKAIFATAPVASGETPADLDEEADSSDDEAHKPKNDKAPRPSVPAALIRFLRFDLLNQTKRRSLPENSSPIHRRLIVHVEEIMKSDHKRYSLANTKQKTHALLVKWSESILNIPTLFELGYGGVTSPMVTSPKRSFHFHTERDVDADDDDDVSSLGDRDARDDRMALDEDAGQGDSERLLKQPLGGITRSSLVRQSSNMTEEDKDIVYQLARKAAREDSSHHANEVMGGQELLGGRRSGSHKENNAPDHETDEPLLTQTITPLNTDDVSEMVVGDDDEQKEENQRPGRSFPRKTPRKRQTGDNSTRNRNHDTQQQQQQQPKNAAGGAKEERKSKSTKPIAMLRENSDRMPLDVDSNENAEKSKSAENGEDAERTLVWHEADSDDSVQVIEPIPVMKPRRKRKALNLDENPFMEDEDDETQDSTESELATNRSSRGRRRMESTSVRRTETSVGSPERKRARAETQPLKEEGSESVAPEVIRAPTSPRKQRKKFTEDEVDAILDGLEAFGAGNWKEIQENDPRLADRTAVQIKDKYRTMKEKGEI